MILASTHRLSRNYPQGIVPEIIWNTLNSEVEFYTPDDTSHPQLIVEIAFISD